MSINPEWEVHPTQVKEWLTAGEDFLLLDVRQLREWNAARIEPALLIPLNEIPARLEAELAPLKNRKIITLCHHGVRSMNAAAFLRRQGFQDVHSMAGGIDAYSQFADPNIPRY